MTLALLALAITPLAFDVTLDFGTIEAKTCQERTAKVNGAYAGQWMSEQPAKLRAGIMRRMMPGTDGNLIVTLCNATERAVKVGKHRARGVLWREDRMPIVNTITDVSAKGTPPSALTSPSTKDCAIFNANGELIGKGDCGPKRVPY